MPRKIRELIRELERAGFVNRGGIGNDAKPYQEHEVRKKIQESKQ